MARTDYDGQGTAARVDRSDFFDINVPKGADPVLPSSQTGRAPTIAAYAINVQTGKRVGVLTIDLSQYNSSSENYFDRTCQVTATMVSPCLLPVILASYAPLALGGEGQPRSGVPGFLWFTPASQPYDYTP